LFSAQNGRKGGQRLMTAKNSPTRIGSIQAQAQFRIKSGGRVKSGKATCTISSRVNLLDSIYNEMEKEKP